MIQLLPNVKIKINSGFFIKDPESSEIGKLIVNNSIELIGTIGSVNFSIKKLSVFMKCPESTIYRYFTNKLMIVQYLSSYYWGSLEYQIILQTKNIRSPKDKLKRLISILVGPSFAISGSFINEDKLQKIIHTEVFYLNHLRCDNKSKENLYHQSYNRIIDMGADFITSIAPKYVFPHMLIVNVIAGIRQQKYFKQNSQVLSGKNNAELNLELFFYHMVCHTIQENTN